MSQGADYEKAAGPLSLEFVAKATLIVIGLWALANLLWLARDVLFITFFALLIASFLSIFVEPLHDRGISRAVSAPLVTILITAVMVGFFMLAWPTLREQFSVIQQQLPPAVDGVQDWFEEQISSVSGTLGESGAAVEEQLRTRVTSEMGGLIGGAMPLLNTALGAVTGFFLVLFAGLFIAISPRTYMRGLIVLLPRSSRRRAGEVLPKAGVAMVQWMKGTALAMLFVGVIATAGLWIIGVPAALALGIIAGLLEFIPYMGPALSFIPAIVVAFAISPKMALWVVLLYAVVQSLESSVITPLLMKQMVKLPPALTLLFQTMMAALFGFLGLLLAVPILATAKTLVEELWVEDVA
ncbi:MAG TPA: AI-2E family transporter, partial [Longimicrobiales bacterium]|nr:AI-2E family transporter [Longimicrobiales bacterium]